MPRNAVVGILAAGLIAGAIAVAQHAQAPFQLNPRSNTAGAQSRAQAGGAQAGAARPRKPNRPRRRAQAPAAPVAAGRGIDPAYGAYQRGYYLTAFQLATQRVEEKGDPKAMTLLGELYANGFGVAQDDKKAAEWYRLAADRGDREAMFALAMFHLGGRAGAVNREQAAKLLAAAAKLGHVAANYDLGLLYLEGQLFPQDFARAAELFRVAAQAGNPEAQYALATLYKEGRGVPKDADRGGALACGGDAPATTPTPWSNTPSRCSTAPASPRTRRPRPRSCRRPPARATRSRRTGSPTSSPSGAAFAPIRSRRSSGTSSPRPAGSSDIPLDEFAQKQKPDVRAAAEKAAQPWLEAIKASRS